MYRVILYVLACALVTVTANWSQREIYTKDRSLRVFAFGGEGRECVFYYGSEEVDVEEKMAEIPLQKLRLVDDEFFQKIAHLCEIVYVLGSRHKRGIQIIFPGTKWCSMGNTAANYDDLGTDVATDGCCRTHDHCPESIASGETAYGLTNTESYTISSCDCDAEFRSCLKGVGIPSAQTVESFFFETLRMSCLAFDHPETCSGFWIFKKCTPDTSQPKQWIIREAP